MPSFQQSRFQKNHQQARFNLAHDNPMASVCLRPAAAVFIALVVGVIGGKWLNSGSATAGANPSKIAVENVDLGKPPEAGDDYYVLLKPAVGETQSTDSSAWDYISSSLQRPVFGAKTRETIRQQGYDVEEEPVLYVIEDDSGGHYIIPQRHVTFVSYDK